MTVQQFERETNLGNGCAHRLRITTRPSTFKRIQDRFPELSIEWLKTGNGEMLRDLTTLTEGVAEPTAEHSKILSELTSKLDEAALKFNAVTKRMEEAISNIEKLSEFSLLLNNKTAVQIEETRTIHNKLLEMCENKR